jgi:hypothetical protein
VAVNPALRGIGGSSPSRGALKLSGFIFLMATQAKQVAHEIVDFVLQEAFSLTFID